MKKQSGLYQFRNLQLHIMLLPAVIAVFIFSYLPMGGIIIAFQKFYPSIGLFGPQKWVGFKNFNYIFSLPNVGRAIINTLSISSYKIVLGIIIPVMFALLLNEVMSVPFKRLVQTISYLPHFLSWVLLSGILIDVLSPSTGLASKLLSVLGIEPIFFLGSNKWFQQTLIATDIWKEFGFASIVYISAITGIDPQLYESAGMDGAGRFKKMWYITVPGITMIVVLMAMLRIGSILSAGFEQVFNVYSPQVYESGDIIDTLVYRMGLMDAQYGPATAIGLFKSVVSSVLTGIAYFAAFKFADYRVF